MSIQPLSEEFHLADGVFVKQMHIERKDILVPQHSHTYDHHSMLARGSVRIWQDGRLVGDFSAPKALFIEAGVKHMFQSLEPNTIIYCIHNVSRTGKVEVAAEHEIGDTPCHGE